jgi:hypothetical protein
LVDDDSPDRAGEAVTDGVVRSEAGPGLGDEHDGDPEAADPFDKVDGGAGPVGELGELVHDHQGLAIRALAGESPVEEVLEDEGANFGGLVAVLGPTDGDVGGPGVLVGPGAVESGANGPCDSFVAGPDPGDVLVGELADGLDGVGVSAPGPLQGPLVKADDELAEGVRYTVTDGSAQDGAMPS